MDIVRRKKITKYLCILWIVTFIVVAICSHAYVIYTRVTTGISPIALLSTHQLIVLAVSLLYFYPLLFLIHHHAKIATMRKTVICAKIGIVFFSIWNVMAVITTIYSYLNSGTF